MFKRQSSINVPARNRRSITNIKVESPTWKAIAGGTTTKSIISSIIYNKKMDITEQVKEIKKNLKILSRLEKEFAVKPNSDNDNPLLYCGVAKSNII